MVSRARSPKLPVGYPADLERHVVLDDGRRAFIRPLLPGDRSALAEAIRTADAETVHGRFLGGAPALTEQTLRRLTELDYRTRLALVAFDDSGQGVGIARYEGTPGSDSAEIAVAVAPDWRHVGLATALVRRLGVAAVQRGIRHFTALFLAGNRPVVELLSAADLPEARRFAAGLVEDVIDLPAGPDGG